MQYQHVFIPVDIFAGRAHCAARSHLMSTASHAACMRSRTDEDAEEQTSQVVHPAAAVKRELHLFKCYQATCRWRLAPWLMNTTGRDMKEEYTVLTRSSRSAGFVTLAGSQASKAVSGGYHDMTGQMSAGVKM